MKLWLLRPITEWTPGMTTCVELTSEGSAGLIIRDFAAA